MFNGLPFLQLILMLLLSILDVCYILDVGEAPRSAILGKKLYVWI